MNFEYKTLVDILKRCSREDLEYALELFDEDTAEEETLEELVERVHQAQRTYLAEVFYMLSAEDLVLLNTMKEIGGQVSVDLTDEKELQRMDAIDRLMDLCLVATHFPDDEERADAFVSAEFLELFAPYLEPERRSFAGYLDEAAKMVEGALYYYGAVSLEKLFEMVHTNHGNMDFTFFNRVLSYKLVLRDLYESVDLGEKEYILVFDYQEFYDLTELTMKEKLYGYRPLTREELLAAGEPDFVEEEEAFMDLYLALEDSEISDEAIKDLFFHVPEEVILLMYMNFTMDLARRHPHPETVVDEFFKSMDLTHKESLKEIRKMFMDYVNKMGRWSYLGYSFDQHPKKKLENKNVVSMKAYLGKKNPS